MDICLYTYICISQECTFFEKKEKEETPLRRIEEWQLLDWIGEISNLLCHKIQLTMPEFSTMLEDRFKTAKYAYFSIILSYNLKKKLIIFLHSNCSLLKCDMFN